MEKTGAGVSFASVFPLAGGARIELWQAEHDRGVVGVGCGWFECTVDELWPAFAKSKEGDGPWTG